jgi:rsbT co-antagonist protein RsbR
VPLLDVELSGETRAAPGRKRHWLANYYPVRVATGAVIGVGVIVLEVTERKQLEENLARRNVELAAREAEKSRLVEQLRLALEEVSTPVIEVWDNVLALPVIGRVDAQRSAKMTERLLAEVTARQCTYVIVDITGVESIDTQTADHFMKLARAVELLGAECIISGVQAQVAQSLVQIGVSFGRLKTCRNLKQALEGSTARLSRDFKA